MRLLIIVCCAFFILISNFSDTECKRGGYRSRGKSGTSSGSSSWFWGGGKSTKTKTAEPYPKQSAPASAPKPSAPHPESAVRKETSHVQQSSNARPPGPGWNVQGTNNQNSGWKAGYQSPGSRQHQQSSHYPASQQSQPHAAVPGSPHQQSSHYPIGQQPQPNGAWPASGQGYNANQQPHGYPGYQHGYAANPQPHGYPGYQQGAYPGYPQHGYNPHSGGMGGYGGYGGMPNGMGGYRGMGGGGMGGYGGWGGGYGGMAAKKKSFFSARTIGNVMAGMLLWHATSSLVGSLFGGSSNKRPVNVYNYYNQPEVKEEMKLPSNILTLCEGNATSLCTPGTTAICTTNSTVLCVATMSQAAPCIEETGLCINTTVPCLDPNNPLCQNLTKEQKDAPINLPCFTNLTVDVNLLNETGQTQNKDHKYCVTTMAVAGPEYKVCNDANTNDYRSVLGENYVWNLTVQPFRKPYNIYNFKHPTETPSGDIVMPVDILTPCIENATKLCVPGVTPICTTFNEIMCLELLSTSIFCEQYNTTCIKQKILCLENDPLCQNRTEEELTVEGDKTLLTVDLPCFANITVNTNMPTFDISTFNGTFPQGGNTSFTYHYHYCIVTLGIPGPESDICLATPPSS